MRRVISMRIIEILRLTEMGLNQRDIGKGTGCGKSTVGDIQKRIRENQLTYEKALSLSDEDILNLLYPESQKKRYRIPEPDYASIYEKLSKKNTKKNLQYLWEEYKTDNPDGLEYSQFCERYSRWKNQTGKNVTMHQEREPGKEMLIDWMGDTLPCVVDSSTGEIHDAHFFVSTLGNSGFPFAEGFPDEKSNHWILAHLNAFHYYGGVPRILIPDNCKTAVTKPQYYDPVLNPSYWEFAKELQVAVIPARIREPEDKACVEESVRWLETWLLEWLRGQTFFSFAELNEAIRYRLAILVKRPYQKRQGTRLSVFNELDLPCLRPLAVTTYETMDMKLRTVPDNYHVEYEGFYYSCPYTLYRKKVTIRATATTIEILEGNRTRIASHPRRYHGKRYVTDPEHMPENHRKYWDSQQFDGARYRSWASQIGENTHYVIDSILKSFPVEQQAYKSCMGLLQLVKKYSQERLEKACAKARLMQSCSYTTVSNILKNGQDLIPDPRKALNKATPKHDQVRGPYYYT